MVHHLPLGNPIANKVDFTRSSSAVTAASRLPWKLTWVRHRSMLLNYISGKARRAGVAEAYPKPRYALLNQM
jgi:hypothetical protein